MATKAILKSWGNSLGVVVPRDLVKAEGLHAGEEVLIEIKKKQSLGELFGTLPHWTIDAQKMKDKLRKEWAR